MWNVELRFFNFRAIFFMPTLIDKKTLRIIVRSEAQEALDREFANDTNKLMTMTMTKKRVRS